MADLQKMPGGAGLLKKQASQQKAKEKRSVSTPGYESLRQSLMLNTSDGKQKIFC